MRRVSRCMRLLIVNPKRMSWNKSDTWRRIVEAFSLRVGVFPYIPPGSVPVQFHFSNACDMQNPRLITLIFPVIWIQQPRRSLQPRYNTCWSNMVLYFNNKAVKLSFPIKIADVTINTIFVVPTAHPLRWNRLRSYACHLRTDLLTRFR